MKLVFPLLLLVLIGCKNTVRALLPEQLPPAVASQSNIIGNRAFLGTHDESTAVRLFFCTMYDRSDYLLTINESECADYQQTQTTPYFVWPPTSEPLSDSDSLVWVYRAKNNGRHQFFLAKTGAEAQIIKSRAGFQGMAFRIGRRSFPHAWPARRKGDFTLVDSFGVQSAGEVVDGYFAAGEGIVSYTVASATDSIPVAIQEPGTFLYQTAKGNTGFGMAPGTSPSLTLTRSGETLIAFQANTNVLWLTGPSGTCNTGISLMPGTSPSVATLSSGAYVVTYQKSDGHLGIAGTDGRGISGPCNLGIINTGYGIAPRTSPSITAAPNNSYEIAFVTWGREILVTGPNVIRFYGNANCPPVNVNSSPSIAITRKFGAGPLMPGLPPNETGVAYQSTDNSLFLQTSTYGWRRESNNMFPDTNPSVAESVNGDFLVAFANRDSVLTVSNSISDERPLNFGMRRGSSPSLRALDDEGNYIVAFQDANGQLWTVRFKYDGTSEFKNHDLQIRAYTNRESVMKETNPAVR